MPASCIKYTIVVRGDTDEARDAALEEAMVRIKAGNLSGTDSNDEGAFYFDSTQDVPAGEWPAEAINANIQGTEMATTETGLCDELQSYCEREKLPYISADELILQASLSLGQRGWLSEYIVRWDAFMDSEEAHALPLKTALELAGQFVTVLRETVSADDFAACMTARCEPDDVCDANMVMANAFSRLHQRSTWMGSDEEEGRCTQAEVDRDLELWNNAVEIVRSQCGRVR